MEAIEALERALASGGESARTRTMLGIAYARTRQIERAFDQLERAVAMEPQSFTSRCALGELCLWLSMGERAREHLDRALACACTAQERSYVQQLLRGDGLRDADSPAPAFRRPFWSWRRRQGTKDR